MLKRIINKLKGKTFLASLSLLTFGSIVSQIITFLLSPVISRVYTDFQMGQYTSLLVMVSVFSSISMGRYELVIVSENDNFFVRTLVKLSKLILIASTPILTIISFTYLKFSTDDLKVSWVFFLIFFILFILNGLILLYTSILNREKKYRELAFSNILNVTIKNIFTVLLGFLNFKVWGLLISLVLGLIVQIIYLFNSIDAFYLKDSDIQVKQLKTVAKEHDKQIIYSTPAALAMNFSAQSNNIFIDILFDKALLGQYSFTHRILALPISLISTNVSKVYFETASREYNETGTYYNTFRKTTLFLAIIGFFMGVAIFAFGPFLVSWFLGSEWELAGILSRYMAPFYSIRFVVAPLTMGTIISKKQDYELQMQILFVTVSVISFLIVKIFSLELLQYIVLSSSLTSVLYIIYFLRLYNIVSI